ncbi:hypothetical protein VA7868_01689 [Vibrio aerogenes CECT 7868]|uniref:Uncharacterized protein n=1 Tax=Vibrio aerogenes CECT 7868 TaxID=1216006 RepID=A0A1M5YFA6_9VIBR|nr:hypothetical protein VA7868_01689 [Vibrio aerogenes CECT 7868]
MTKYKEENNSKSTKKFYYHFLVFLIWSLGGLQVWGTLYCFFHFDTWLERGISIATLILLSQLVIYLLNKTIFKYDLG